MFRYSRNEKPSSPLLLGMLSRKAIENNHCAFAVYQRYLTSIPRDSSVITLPHDIRLAVRRAAYYALAISCPAVS